MPSVAVTFVFLQFFLFTESAEVIWFRDDPPHRFNSEPSVQEQTNYAFYDPPDHHPKGYLQFPDVMKQLPVLSKIPNFPLRSATSNVTVIKKENTTDTTNAPVINDDTLHEAIPSLMEQLAMLLPQKVQQDSVLDIVDSRNKSLYQKVTELGEFFAKNSNTSSIDQQEMLHGIVEAEKQPENALRELADSLKPEFKDVGMHFVEIQKNKSISELQKQETQAAVLGSLADSAKMAMRDFDIFLQRSTRTRRQLYNNQNAPQVWNFQPTMYQRRPPPQAQQIVPDVPNTVNTNYADMLTKNRFLMPTALECVQCGASYPPKGFFPGEPTRPPNMLNFNPPGNNGISNFGPPPPPSEQPPPVFDVDLSEKPLWNNAFNERNRLFGKYIEKPKPRFELPQPTPIVWNAAISNGLDAKTGFGQGYGFGYLTPIVETRLTDLKTVRGDPPDYSFSVDRKPEMRPSQIFASRSETQSQAQIVQQATAYLQKQAQIASSQAYSPVQTEPKSTFLQQTTVYQSPEDSNLAQAPSVVTVSDTTQSQAPQISIPLKTFKASTPILNSAISPVSTGAIGRFDTDIGRYDDGSSRNTHRFVIPSNVLQEVAPQSVQAAPTLRPLRPSPWGSNTGFSKSYRPVDTGPAGAYVIPPPPSFGSGLNQNSEPSNAPTSNRILTDEDSQPPLKQASNTVILTRNGPANMAPARDPVPSTTPKPEESSTFQTYPDYRQGLFPVPLNHAKDEEQPALNPDREIPNKDNRPEDLSLDRLGPQGYYGGGSNRYKQDNGKLSESGFRKDINDQIQWPSAVDDRRRNSFYDPTVRHGPAAINIHNQPLPPYGGTSRTNNNDNVYKEGDDLSQSEPVRSRIDYGNLVAKEYTTALPWYLETTTVVTVPKVDVDERLMYPAERDSEIARARTREALSEATLQIPQQGQIRPYFGPEEITRSRYTNENPAGTNIHDGTGKHRFVMIDLPNTSTIS